MRPHNYGCCCSSSTASYRNEWTNCEKKNFLPLYQNNYLIVHALWTDILSLKKSCHPIQMIVPMSTGLRKRERNTPLSHHSFRSVGTKLLMKQKQKKGKSYESDQFVYAFVSFFFFLGQMKKMFPQTFFINDWFILHTSALFCYERFFTLLFYTEFWFLLKVINSKGKKTWIN